MVTVIIGIIVIFIAVGYPVYKKVVKNREKLTPWDYMQYGFLALALLLVFFIFISNRLLQDGSAPDWVRSLRDVLNRFID